MVKYILCPISKYLELGLLFTVVVNKSGRGGWGTSKLLWNACEFSDIYLVCNNRQGDAVYHNTIPPDLSDNTGLDLVYVNTKPNAICHNTDTLLFSMSKDETVVLFANRIASDVVCDNSDTDLL